MGNTWQKSCFTQPFIPRQTQLCFKHSFYYWLFRTIDGDSPEVITCMPISWSTYKHHNTLKLLIGVTTNSWIVFSQRHTLGAFLTKKSLFRQDIWTKFVSQYSVIMCDKAFEMNEECDTHWVTSFVPPAMYVSDGPCWSFQDKQNCKIKNVGWVFHSNTKKWATSVNGTSYWPYFNCVCGIIKHERTHFCLLINAG